MKISVDYLLSRSQKSVTIAFFVSVDDRNFQELYTLALNFSSPVLRIQSN